MKFQGFFNLAKLRQNTVEDPDCEKCGLYRTVNSPRMNYTGEGLLETMFICEAPGEYEDLENKQLVGDAGKLLRFDLKRMGYDLDRDFWKINAVNCRPTTSDRYGKTKNRSPNKKEILCCRPKVKSAIKELNPKFIILGGQVAVESFFGGRAHKIFREDLSLGRWRHLCIPDPETNAWVMPIIHPSYPNRYPDFRTIFQKDLYWALSCLRRQPPKFDDELAKVRISANYDEIINFLRYILPEQPWFAFDFETNCLRPYFPEAKLLTMSASINGQSAFAFPYDWPGIWTPRQKAMIKYEFSQSIANENIGKVVQGRAMEETWSTVHFVEPKNIIWDAQLASHIIDERDKFTGLKFQAFVRWGVVGYDDHVEPYKKPPSNRELYNRLHKLPWTEVASYNGMDSMFTGRLYEEQPAELRNPSLKKANQFLQEGMTELVKMSHRGIPSNAEYFQEQVGELGNRMKEVEGQILSSDAAVTFKKKMGRQFDISSRNDLQEIFFKILKLKPTRINEKSQTASVDHSFLTKVDSPIAEQILYSRKLKKMQEYAERCALLTVNGHFHPSLNLHLAVTYRSSSDTPNLQNFPKRDKEALQLIRGGIIAPPGWQILGADFGAMEVRGFAWYCKDPTLIYELSHGMDPHGVWGEFFQCSRFDGKNSFVFPTIYGAYFENIAREFQARGYKHITAEMVKVAQEKFWNKYPYGLEWQKKVIHDYYKTGYVETYLGFRRRGILTKNQIVNYPIQSTCFHCLVWTYKKLDKIAEQEGWSSFQIGQIHDEILYLLWPDEFSHMGKTIERVMTDDILEWAPWINVKPIAEISVSEIGGPWSKMHDFTKATNNDWLSIEGKIWQGIPQLN